MFLYLMSYAAYLKIIVCSVTLPAAVIAIAVVANTWISNIFRNPDAAEKAFLPAGVSLAAIELVTLACLGIIFGLKS